MNWLYIPSIILIVIVITYFFIRRVRIKNQLQKAGTTVIGTVTTKSVTTGRYATVYVHYQFTTLEGWRVNGVSESTSHQILTEGDQVPVLYDADDSSNNSLKSEVGTDKNFFFIVLLWGLILLVLYKIWR